VEGFSRQAGARVAFQTEKWLLGVLIGGGAEPRRGTTGLSPYGCEAAEDGAQRRGGCGAVAVWQARFGCGQQGSTGRVPRFAQSENKWRGARLCQ